MNLTRRHAPCDRARCRAFSLVELLVAISVSAVFFTAAALVYQNVLSNNKRLASIEPVALGKDTIANFYKLDAASINVYSAPNYGRASFANNLRDIFLDDVGQASAVFCLGRSGLNKLRPETIPYPAGSSVLDTPERFREHLEEQYGSPDSDVYVPYKGNSTAEDATIYLLEPSDSATELNVLSIYEIDIVPMGGVGNYVSVRRYIGQDLTNYYDVYYPKGTGNPFNPLVVHFPKAGLVAATSDSDHQKFMKADEHSFYFIWWPDPATRFLESATPPAPTVADTEPVWDYYKMGGRTSFMFTVPMFPALQ